MRGRKGEGKREKEKKRDLREFDLI